MKNCKLGTLVILLLSLLFVSCENPNPLTGKQWFGEIIRVKDSRVLSPIVLDFNGKNLKVYANAIFGSNRTDFSLNSEEDNQYFYSNKERNIFLIITLNQDNSITVNPNQGGTFYANAIVDENRSKTFIESQYENKEKSFNPENYLLGGFYEGYLYRKTDNTKLSKIVLAEENGTTNVFSNAIFGENNIVLNNIGFHKELDCFKYRTNEINDILIFSSENKLNIEGSDFYAILEPINASKSDLSFFHGKKVSTNSLHYPTINTVYSGYITSTNPKMAKDLEYFTINATVTFIDYNSLNLTIKSEVNDTYIRLYSLTYGTDYNISKKLVSSMESSDTQYISYYINEKGQIVAENKGQKLKDIYTFSDDKQTLNWMDKASGFNGQLKLK